MLDLLREISAAGIVVSRFDAMPKIAFPHVGPPSSTLETLQEAAESGTAFFHEAPRIIFVILPDYGNTIIHVMHSVFLLGPFLLTLTPSNRSHDNVVFAIVRVAHSC